MQFSKYSTIFALSLVSFTIASPIEPRDSTSNIERRDLATCQSKVMASESACVKSSYVGADGTREDSIQVCTSKALKGFNSCISTISTRKRSAIDDCATSVTIKQGDCLVGAGTDQKKVSKCSAHAYKGYVACVG